VPMNNMVDRTHNGSPMPGMTRNDDPALDIKREHHHEHVHHSAHAAHEDSSHTVYSSGTTDEKGSKLLNPSAQDSHIQHHLHHPEKQVDIEKTGAGFDYEEKDTRRSSDPEEEVTRKRWSVSSMYRRYRLFVHIFLGMFFTG
jgi:CNT family concentrative nucleoside transporter